MAILEMIKQGPGKWDTVKIIAFNYDGKGAALGLCDGNIEIIPPKELAMIFSHDPATGARAYRIDDTSPLK